MIYCQILIKEKEDLVAFSVFLIGLIVGSFLGMLIHRIPLGISLINPKRSACMECKEEIKWYHNIPIISYIFLKGRCSNCKTKISTVYPLVELLTAIVTLLLFLKLGLNSNFITTALLFYTLIALSFIDLKYKAVPDYLLILALLFSLFSSGYSLLATLAFAGGFALLELFVTFYIQNIKSRITKDEALKEQRAMGEGDIPIAGVIGGLLGIKLGLVAIFAGAIFAIIPSIYNLITKKDIETAFIPFLSLGLFVVFLFQDTLAGYIK